MTLTNTSTTTPLDVSNVKVVDAGAVQFEIGLDGCSGQTVAPSGTCTVTVQFAPTKKGAFTAHLQFTDTAATMQKSLLKGTAS